MSTGRRSIRLPHFHYGGGSGYFITLCLHNRFRGLGVIRDGHVHLSRLGQVVAEHWGRISTRDSGIALDEFIVMPDHLHGIVEFDGRVSVTVPRVIAWFKGTSLVAARRAGLWGGTPLWQRGYYDHVIRGPRDRDTIRAYIRSNPVRWELRASASGG
jgi:REP element-mobilizing transposase RayT